ncbi:Uncharacterised protein [uncultured archaeon]|nr:Uncharacterised protein [uncultured archaeon]
MAISELVKKPWLLAMFLPVLLLVVFVAANYAKLPQESTGNETAPDGQTGNAAAEASQALACPFECCEAGNYLEKPCYGAKICVNNKCEKKECPYECCDDESSKAEYAVKGCDGNMLCEDDKCVLRPCWSDCCVGSRGFEEKSCDGNMICNSGLCEKPPCPDKYKCCPANDKEYSEKACRGNNVCKFRICKAP